MGQLSSLNDGVSYFLVAKTSNTQYVLDLWRMTSTRRSPCHPSRLQHDFNRQSPAPLSHHCSPTSAAQSHEAAKGPPCSLQLPPALHTYFCRVQWAAASSATAN